MLSTLLPVVVVVVVAISLGGAVFGLAWWIAKRYNAAAAEANRRDSEDGWCTYCRQWCPKDRLDQPLGLCPTCKRELQAEGVVAAD